ncbi:MAG TPA: substrate-binding domain-containing protein [Bacteroidales bacterium]|nr:substrate-binding domain-containing protein [Bacteroidales bacterium]
MKKIILIFSVAALLFNSCGPDQQKKNTADSDNTLPAMSGNISVVGSEILYPLMNKWKQEFEKGKSDVKISVRAEVNCQYLHNIASDKIQIAMVSRALSEKEKQDGFWAVPVAKDAVLPVISFDNNNLQKIVFTGVTKDKLAALFTGKIRTWGQLLDIQTNEPIDVYKLSDTSETTEVWSDFLNVDANKFTGTVLYSENEMSQKIAGNKNGIGFCSMIHIFDVNTGLKKKNLYVLPVDLNANKMADDNELVFDKLDDIKSAVSSGKYPSPPARELYLVCKSAPQDAAIKSFIIWILTTGQSYCAQFGFANIEKNEASEYLKQLK